MIIETIKNYLELEEKRVCTGEGERIIEDIKEIIRSWEED